MSRPASSPRPPREEGPNRYLPLLIVALVVVLLSLLVRNFFARVILAPLLDIVLAFYVLYRSLPQNLIWALLVLLAFLVAMRALWPKGGWRLRERRPTALPGRMERLAELITLAPERPYARWQLAHQLRETLLALLARQSGMPLKEMHSRSPAGVVTLIAGLKRAQAGVHTTADAQAPEALVNHGRASDVAAQPHECFTVIGLAGSHGVRGKLPAPSTAMGKSARFDMKSGREMNEDESAN